MNFPEICLRFLAGGTLVVVVSFLARAKSPLFAGLFVLFPVITIIGFYFIGQSCDAFHMRKITLFSMISLPTTLIFLGTFYFLTGKVDLVWSVIFSIAAWCAAALLVMLLGHVLIRTGN
jgi:uncharacterized membrane protein (GlpM family)